MKKNILQRVEQTQADMDSGYGNLSSCTHPEDLDYNDAPWSRDWSPCGGSQRERGHGRGLFQGVAMCGCESEGNQQINLAGSIV